MQTNEENLVNTVKMIVRANTHPFGDESISELVQTLKQKYNISPKSLIENSDEIILFINIKIGDLISPLGNYSRDEIKLLKKAINVINFEKALKAQPKAIAISVERYLAKTNTAIKINSTDDILDKFKKIHNLERVIRCIKLIKLIPSIEDILPYIKRYLIMPINQINEELTMLEDSLAQIKIISFDNKAYDIATDCLMKVGHPRVSVKSKSISHLIVIIENHYLGALGTIYAKTKAGNKHIAKEDIFDGIGLYLLDSEIASSSD